MEELTQLLWKASEHRQICRVVLTGEPFPRLVHPYGICQTSNNKISLVCWQEAGFTKAVADKLLGIGNCEFLYKQEADEFIGFVDGWSTLYEISKLPYERITLLWKALRDDPSLKVSRSLVKNFAENKPLGEKVILYATIEAEKSKFDKLQPQQVAAFASKLKEIHGIFNGVPGAFTFHQRHEGVKLLWNVPQSNNSPQLEFTA